MKVHVAKKLTDAEQKDLELKDLKDRLEATEEALLTLMFGGEADV